MSLNYKLQNLIGGVYHGGNIEFSLDGNCVISPVSNRVSLFDLKNNYCKTLAVESRFNVKRIALSADGCAMMIVNESNEGLYVSLISGTIIHRHRFVKTVKDLKFSPDGRHLAVCRDTDVHIFRAPGLKSNHFNSFFLEKVVHTSQDSTLCIEWSHDSNLLVVGSRDTSCKVITMGRFKNAHICAVTGHVSAVIGVHFMDDSYDMLSIDDKGFVVDWRSSLQQKQLIPYEREEQDETPEFHTKHMLTYSKKLRHSFHETMGSACKVLCSAYHKSLKLLVCGFKSGSFTLHEMPHFSLIHNLSVGDSSVDSVCISKSGDWIGVGCGEGGQLIVWEWQSQTYAMKQHSHRQMLTCVQHSPDAHSIATGAEDGKVKVWTQRTGFCVITFSEHTAAVTGVAWTQSAKALLSSSLDGTVRAFDLKRYRNFRTLTTPEPAQLSCVVVDSSGDVVCSSAKDLFDVFVWSLQTGRLLEVMSGHTAPVHSLHFNPVHPVLASVSWDKTLRTWDVFQGKAGCESIALPSDGVDVKFSPDGVVVAALTMDCQITLFEWKTATQLSSIEARLDLDAGRANDDQIMATTSGAAKSFTCMSFSVDGELLLVGGQSRFLCLYSVAQQILLKKWPVSINYSLDAVALDFDRRQMTEVGSLRLVDASDSENEDGNLLPLPGSAKCDPAARKVIPEVRVTQVSFSGDGRCWSACSTEGLLVYSLDSVSMFDPYQLDQGITPASIRECIGNEDYGTALTMSLKLNQHQLIEEALERTPKLQIDILTRTMPFVYAEKLLQWLADALQSTIHLHFYLLWTTRLLLHHGAQFKARTSQNAASLTSVQQVLQRKRNTIAAICDYNRYAMEYVVAVSKQRSQ